MNKWKITLSKRANKQFERLPDSIQCMAVDTLQDLEKEGPVPRFSDVKKTGTDEYRIRINYRYRIRYRVINNCMLISVFYLGHRQNAYHNQR